MLQAMTPSARALRPADWLRLVLLSLLWGGSFLFNGIAVAELAPPTIVAARVGLGALLLLAFMYLRGHALPRQRRVWLELVAMGLLNNAIPFSLIVWSQARIAGGLASILNATTPLFTMLVAHVTTSDDRMTPSRVTGLLVGFAGVVVVVGPAVLGRSEAEPVVPQLAVLAAALSYALAGVYGRRFSRRGLAPVVVATGQVLASSMLLVPVAVGAALVRTGDAGNPAAVAHAAVLPSGTVLAALLGLGLLSTAAGYILYFRLLGAVGATNLLMVTFLIPLTAILLGVLILDEALVGRQVGGMLIVFAGIGVAQRSPSLRRRRGSE